MLRLKTLPCLVETAAQMLVKADGFFDIVDYMGRGLESAACLAAGFKLL